MPKDEKFSRSCRLTDRRQFVRLFDSPKVYKAPTFQVFYKSNDNNKARLGITIKGRLSSIWRTRLKRVVREWFRKAQDEIGFYDCNIVLKLPEKLDKKYVDLLKEQLIKWKNPRKS